MAPNTGLIRQRIKLKVAKLQENAGRESLAREYVEWNRGRSKIMESETTY
jgi:anaerobic ribonucleoside-triphosphate reductase